MNVLYNIIESKRDHVSKRMKLEPMDVIKAKASIQESPRGFIWSLKNTRPPSIIAEVKKASPSKGIIRKDFDPVAIAQTYEISGAACLSVLTDEPYFKGKDGYLSQIHEAVKLPILRKDFMIDPYQIYESRALGADCILLIMAALGDDQAKELYDLSIDLGMDVLVEVHNKEELVRALELKPRMIGVNNRNLKTLEVDIQTSHDLAKDVLGDVILVAESGIATHETIRQLQDSGFEAFLIGESLMREENIETALQQLLGKKLTQSKN